MAEPNKTEAALFSGPSHLQYGSLRESARGVERESEEEFCPKSFLQHGNADVSEPHVSQQQTTEGYSDSSEPVSPLPDSSMETELRHSVSGPCGGAPKVSFEEYQSTQQHRAPVQDRDLADMRSFLSHPSFPQGLCASKLEAWRGCLSGKSGGDVDAAIPGAFVSIESGRANSFKEPPRLGENGNWQCHACLNINYPRRGACNRCQTERSSENDRFVAEFNALKEEFLSMGLEPVAASAAASAQQAARKALNGTASEQRGFLSSLDSEDFGEADSIALQLKQLQDALEGHAEALPSRTSRSQGSLPSKLEQKFSSGSSFTSPSRDSSSASRANFLQGRSRLNSFGSSATGTASLQTQKQPLHLNSNLASLRESKSYCSLQSETDAATLLLRSLLRQPASEDEGSSLDFPSSCAMTSTESAEVVRLRAQLSSTLGKHSLSTGEFEGGLLPIALLQLLLLKAHATAESLVEKFVDMGEANPTEKAADVLRTALAVLGFSADDENCSSLQHPIAASPLEKQKSVAPPSSGAAFTTSRQRTAERGFGAPLLLVHPEEFKNPSSFLKIYGDPLCEARTLGGSSPPASVNGNWMCVNCHNVNFPRRFRCNKCAELRDAEGDRVVAEYAKAVYTQHAKTYKLQGAGSQSVFSTQQQNANCSLLQHTRSGTSSVAETSVPPNSHLVRGPSFSSGARLACGPRNVGSLP